MKRNNGKAPKQEPKYKPEIVYGVFKATFREVGTRFNPQYDITYKDNPNEIASCEPGRVYFQQDDISSMDFGAFAQIVEMCAEQFAHTPAK